MKALKDLSIPNCVLTPSQRQDFFNQGYVLLPSVFSELEIDKMAECFNRLKETAEKLGKTQIYKGSQFVVEGKKIDRIVWCGAAEPDLLNIGVDPRLTFPASQLLGSPEMDQLICQAHFKLPADGVEFEWHQDSEHRRYGTPMWKDVNGKGSYVQTLLNIDPMRADNGPLYVVPGSAKLGHLYLDKARRDYKDTAVALSMDLGSVLLLNPYTVHGSFPNTSKTPRRVFINGYAYPGANSRVYPGEGSGRRVKAS